MRHQRCAAWHMALLVMLLAAAMPSCRAQLSKGIVGDHSIKKEGNKFLQRKATQDVSPPPDHKSDEVEAEGFCPQNLELRWMSEVTSSVYATPLITDLFSDGRKDIVVPSFVHHLEVLEANDGSQAAGWPAFHKSTVHTSPLMYDLDFDGVQDILLATYDGEILAFRDNGEQMAERLTIPRLRVRRDWYKGLAADPVDHSQPDVGDTDRSANVTASQQGRVAGVQRKLLMEDAIASSELETASNRRRLLMSEDSADLSNSRRKLLQTQPDLEKAAADAALVQKISAEHAAQQQQQHAAGQQPQAAANLQQQQQDQELQRLLHEQEAGNSTAQVAAGGVHTAQQHQAAQQSGKGVFAEDAGQVKTINVAGAPQGAEISEDNELADEATDSFGELFEDDGDAKHGDGLDEEWDPHGEEGSADFDADELDTDDTEDYEDMMRAREEELRREALLEGHTNGTTGDAYQPKNLDPDDMWEDESFVESKHETADGFVYIDAHILCNPVIGDIDGDGHDELVVAASYFFDREYYDDAAHAAELPQGIDLSKYIASGIVVFDLRTRAVKWSTHLDLSTDSTTFRAYAYSPPTIADIDGDGKLEVIVGTSVGFLYVLDSKGNSREGWPIQMGEIQAQAVVADINADGKMEIVAADIRGNVAAFTAQGTEVWERHLASLVAQGASLGDIDADGELEVVVATASGKIYAMSGKTGKDTAAFPFATRGRIMAPVLITQLTGDHEAALQLVVVSFDGFLYVVDGVTACADVVDIGETSYSMVLADDLNNDGRIDLLVTTMNGNVYVFETPAKHHPLASMTSQVHGHNNHVARVNHRGIFATPASRAPRDVRGKSLPVRFEIVDSRVEAASGEEGGVASRSLAETPAHGPYTVSVSLQGVNTATMNAGDQPIIGLTDTYTQPGTYTLEIPCPQTRSTATIHIEMTDESKTVFVDDFSLSFHMHYYRLLKWLIAAPFTAAALAVLALKLGAINDQILPTLGNGRL